MRDGNDVCRWGEFGLWYVRHLLCCAMKELSLSPLDTDNTNRTRMLQLTIVCALTNVQAFDRYFKYFICSRFSIQLVVTTSWHWDSLRCATHAAGMRYCKQ